MHITQGYTNPGRRVVQGTKFWTVALSVCGSSVWNLLHVHLSGAHNFAMASVGGGLKFVQP